MKLKVSIWTNAINSLYTVSSIIVTLMVTWTILSVMNFSYGFWHDHGGIKEAIELYGPQNYHKRGFGHTTRDERIRVFNEMAKAVQNHGEGLEDITYHAPPFPEEVLLRKVEVVHLQDVANLIDLAMVLGYSGLAVWLLLLLFFYLSNIPPPKFTRQVLTLTIIIAVTTLVTLAIGPVKVFSYMHHVVFPDAEGHEWFFYYRQSLMSTLLLAPVIFGWIAIEWVCLTVLWFVPQQYLSIKILQTLQQNKHKLIPEQNKHKPLSKKNTHKTKSRS